MFVPPVSTNDLWIPPDTLLHMQYTCYSTSCVSFLGGEPASQTDRKNSEYFHSFQALARHECWETRDGPEKVSQYMQHDLITAAWEWRRPRRKKRRRWRGKEKDKNKIPNLHALSLNCYEWVNSCIYKMHSTFFHQSWTGGRYVVMEALLSKCPPWQWLGNEGWDLTPLGWSEMHLGRANSSDDNSDCRVNGRFCLDQVTRKRLRVGRSYVSNAVRATKKWFIFC